MVMRDKTFDLLDSIFLGETIDISQVLTPDGEVMPFPEESRIEENSSEEISLETFIMADTDNVVQLEEVDGLMFEEIIIDGSFDQVPDVVEIEPEIKLGDENTVIYKDVSIQVREKTERTIPHVLEIDTSSTHSWSSGPLSSDKSWSPCPLTPLIKEELKYTIQTRRLTEGKQEMAVDFSEPEPERLTGDEERRREERRLKNKLAARKCRDKKRERGDELEEETHKLLYKQKRLKTDIKRLREEREQLQEIIQIHTCVCPQLRNNLKSK